MNDLNRSHPSAEQLAAFGSGQLEDPAAVAIDAHLAECETCRTVVEALPHDTLVSLLRAAALPQTTTPSEPTESQVQQQAATCTNAPVEQPHVSGVPPELLQHPRYRVLELLGRGGMGAVYKAEHQVMERLVALKVINRKLLDEADALERFQREVKAAARLAHPNIVAAYDADHAGTLHFLVMEYVAGTTLARLVEEQGPLPVAAACDYVRQAALGLQHAFERGMIHRDIKPQNLMRTPEGQVKILDFGLARLATASTAADALTETNVVMGTPDYIAPEQARDAHSADIRADLYSLGCTLYYLLTGQTPFPGGTSMQKIMRHLEQTPRSLTQLRNDLPAGLVCIVERMMAKDRAQRYQTPAEVAQELVLFISPQAAAPMVAPPSPPSPPSEGSDSGNGGGTPRRQRWHGSRLRVACVVLLVALGLGGTLLAPAVYRVATNRGTLVIEADDPNVEVIVKQAGAQVQIIDARTTHTVQLRAGAYELKLAEGKEALRLSTDRFTLKRGDKVVVRVWLEPAVARKAAEPPVPPPAKGTPLPDKARGPSDTRPSLVDFLFRRNDQNGDGLLNFDELPASLRGERDRWDANKDGLLDGNEFRAYYQAQQQQPARRSAAVELVEFGTLVGHRQQVNSVAVSPDAIHIFSGSQDGTVRLWDVASGQEVRRLAEPGDPVLSMALSPDGRRILTSGGTGQVRLWDAATGKLIRSFEGHKNAVSSVAFSPDGRHAASGGDDTTVRLWDVETGRELRLLSGHDGAVVGVAFARDGRQLLSASKDRTLRLWNVDTGKDQRFTGHTAAVRCAAFAPDNHSIISAGEDRTIRLWDVEKGEFARAFSLRSGSSAFPGSTSDRGFSASGRGGSAGSLSSRIVSALPFGAACAVFSPDGRRILTGDGTQPSSTSRTPAGARPEYGVRLWTVSGAVLDTFKGHEQAVRSVAFAPDGRFVVSAGVDKTIRLLWLAEVARSGQPETLAAMPKDKSRLVLDTESPDIPVLVKQAHRLVTVLNAMQRVPSSDLKPGEYELELAGGPQVFELSVDKVTLTAGEVKTVAIRRLPLAEKPARAEIHESASFKGHTDAVEQAIFSSDGRQVISCGRDKTVRVWDVADQREIARFTGHSENVNSVALSPDGRLAASAGGGFWKDNKFVATDYTIRLWEVATGKAVRSFSGHTGWLRGLAFSSDGRSLVSGSVDGTVRMWDVNGGRELRQFRHEGGTVAVAFAPEGRRVLSGGRDALVRLWDVDTGHELRRFEGHTGEILSVAFSPDGRLVLAAGADNTMRLWDADTAEPLRSFAHPTHIVSVAFSPDGRRVLSASGHRHGAPAGFDYCVRLWDLASGRELGRFERHTNSVTSVAFSPDGHAALSAGWDSSVRLLKLPETSNSTLTETGSIPGHTGQIQHMVLSADGRKVLTCSNDNTLRLRDVETGQEIRRFEGKFDIAWGVALSPDGKQALSGGGGQIRDGKWQHGADFSLHLWDIDTGAELRRFQGHTNWIRGVAFSPDGRHALSGADDTTVRLWQVQTGKCLRVLQGHSDMIWHVAFSPDGRSALSSSLDRTMRLWDVATGRESRRFEGHREGVRDVAFSPDGTQILSGSDDRTMRLWDVATGRELRSFLGHWMPVYGVAFSSDGRHALSGSFDGTARLWDASTGRELARSTGSNVWSVAFLPDGQSALSSHSDGVIRRLQMPQAGKDAKQLDPSDQGLLTIQSGARAGWLLIKRGKQVVQVLDATASQQIKLKAGAYQVELAGRHDGLRLSTDRFTLSRGGSQAVTISREPALAAVEITEVRRLMGHGGPVDGLALSGDGRFAVSCGGDQTVRIWDVAAGREVRRLEGQSEQIYAVAFSPDGKYVLGAGGGLWRRGEWSMSDFSLRLWEAATGKVVRRLEGHTHMVRCLAFSPDGRYALSGAWDATVSLWDVQTGREVHTLKGHRSGIHCIAFSPDGRRALSGDWDRAVWLWDLTAGKPLRSFDGHGGPVRSVAFSPDGRHALSVSMDRTMRLWDVETGNQVRQFPEHPTGIICAAFSPDGRRILSSSGVRFNRGNQEAAGSDYRVRLWDVASGCEIGRFDGHTQVPSSLVFSPDGRFALSGGWDKTLRLLAFTETDKPTIPGEARYTGQLDLDRNGFNLPVVVKQGDRLVAVIHPKSKRTTELPIGKYDLELAGQPAGFRLSVDRVTLRRDGKASVALQRQPPVDKPPPPEIQEVRRFEGHTAAVVQVALSPDGKQALSCSWDKSLRLWDVETGQELHKFEGITEEVWTCAFSPDGQQALSAGGGGWKDGKFIITDSSIRLWDLATRKEIRRLTGHKGRVWSVAFSPDGKSVLSGSDDTTVRLWDVATGSEKQVFEGHHSQVRRVAFAPDGRHAVSGSWDATIRLWDLETGKEVRRFEGHTELVSGVAFAPDGRQLLSCAHDMTMRLWDVETGRQLRSFVSLETSPFSVAFSADGRRAVCGCGYRAFKGGFAGFDYRVYLWNLETGQQIGQSQDHKGPVGTVVFAPDGQYALAGSEDNSVRLLKLPE